MLIRMFFIRVWDIGFSGSIRCAEAASIIVVLGNANHEKEQPPSP
jgi:hypothetical protein